MITNPVIFYIAFALILVFALLSLFARNVVYALLSAIVVFFFGAIFFFLLGSEYNAIIQAIIYGFAVPIIIGVSIMFLSERKQKEKNFILPYIILVCAGISIMAFVYLVLMSLTIAPDTFNLMGETQINTFDTIKAFAKGIYINYVWAFELVSLLLLIVIAGIGLMKKKGI